ncbi:UNVERIFIED_CONTAM: B3 domain-containing protein REM16 [Sesamum calycinum]|uniref:B3 domain-containing protein REM16 n=1 Tax=Sesamum calycinum TaxID=2727403 RepID=A0AAW2PA71_9LAMI
MVGDCMNCRKWEEDMYWSRFQTVQFCQVTGRFDQQLAIPKKFAKNLREKMAGTVALKGPSGHEWSVGLVTNGDMLLLKHGWKAFVDDHSLEENDILIFKYNGNSRFDVTMFDQESLCEKATSYFVKKCEHTKSARGNKRRRSLEESFDETNQSSDDVADDHRAKKSRSDAARTPPSRIQPSRSTSRKGKRGSRGTCTYPLQLKSRRREVTEEEKQRAQQMAVVVSSDNSFIVVMRASHVYKGLHLPKKSLDIELRVKDNVWKAKYHYKGYGGGLTGGGKNFVLENFLEEFDVCLFDIVSGTEDTIIFDVKIFRVVEEVIPPSQVAKETSQGTGKRAKF